MQPLSNKLNEFSKNTLGVDFSVPLSQRLNSLMQGATNLSTSAVNTVGNAVINHVANPILDHQEAVAKEAQRQEILNRPSVITQGPATITHNAEGLPPTVITPAPEIPVPAINQAASVIASQPIQQSNSIPASIIKNQEQHTITTIPKGKLVFQEHGVNSGIPYIDTPEGRKSIDKVNFIPPPLTKEIKSITIKDRRPGQSVTITDPKQIKIANEIKQVADAVAPQYTDYLLRLARYEGIYNAKQRNDNGPKGIDKGIFQINNHFFPEVPETVTDDVKKATLWAIALIEAGGQKKWVADPYVKNAKTEITYAE
jgi:hypothetical protein